MFNVRFGLLKSAFAPRQSRSTNGAPPRMQRHPEYTRQRIRQLAERMRTKIYSQRIAIEDFRVSERTNRISYAEAQKLKKWKPAKIGMQFGPLWATYWFRGRAKVPKEWRGQRVDLLWVSFSEATL